MSTGGSRRTTIVSKWVGPLTPEPGWVFQVGSRFFSWHWHACALPKRRERKRRRINRGDVIECDDCHQWWKLDHDYDGGLRWVKVHDMVRIREKLRNP